MRALVALFSISLLYVGMGLNAHPGLAQMSVQTPPPTTALDRCKSIIAAYDVGSASLKVKVAEVDVCLQKIIRILGKPEASVRFKERTQNGAFPESLQADGLSALKALKEEAQVLGARAHIGVATEAFRKASNAAAWVARVQKELGIDLRIVSQRQEAIIGWTSAQNSVAGAQNIAWDIGGGSVQIAFRANGGFETILSTFASESAKRRILVNHLGANPDQVKSPNPIGSDRVSKIQADFEQEIRKSLGKKENKKGFRSLRERLKRSALVVGIGGVHSKSILNQLKAEGEYTLPQLESAIQARALLSDVELGGGPYVDTDVSNLILVASWMRVLGVRKVKIAKADLTEGLLSGAWNLLGASFWGETQDPIVEGKCKNPPLPAYSAADNGCVSRYTYSIALEPLYSEYQVLFPSALRKGQALIHQAWVGYGCELEATVKKISKKCGGVTPDQIRQAIVLDDLSQTFCQKESNSIAGSFRLYSLKEIQRHTLQKLEQESRCF